LLAHGVLDLGFATEYRSSLLLGNQVTPAGGASAGQSVSLDNAEVNLTSGEVPLLRFTTTLTGFVPPGSGDTATYQASLASLIPSELSVSDGVRNAHDLVANVRVHGSTSDGAALTTNWLAFPITVCTGCLVQYPASAADPESSTAGYRCASTSAVRSPPSVPCTLGQDVPFSCEICADTHPICRDPLLNPSLF